jgi:hypothetical protein
MNPGRLHVCELRQEVIHKCNSCGAPTKKEGRSCVRGRCPGLPPWPFSLLTSPHVVGTPTVTLTATGLVLAATVAVLAFFLVARRTATSKDVPVPTRGPHRHRDR